jgi:P27 family predicted phage terminase small subunit
MRGRKPKPTAQKIAEGDAGKKGVHKLDQKLASEPKASRGLPGCPRHLKGRARYAWNFWSEELAAMKLDRRPDGPMLEGACRQYERAVAADLILDREGIVFTKRFVTESGEVVDLEKRKHPAVEISNRCWLIVKAFCSEFGLSPVSRTRLTIESVPSTDDDDLIRALSAPRPRSAETPAMLN